jgi:hypothetical protein
MELELETPEIFIENWKEEVKKPWSLPHNQTAFERPAIISFPFQPLSNSN